MNGRLMSVSGVYSCLIDVHKDLVDAELAEVHDCCRLESCLHVGGAVVQVEVERT